MQRENTQYDFVNNTMPQGQPIPGLTNQDGSQIIAPKMDNEKKKELKKKLATYAGAGVAGAGLGIAGIFAAGKIQAASIDDSHRSETEETDAPTSAPASEPATASAPAPASAPETETKPTMGEDGDTGKTTHTEDIDKPEPPTPPEPPPPPTPITHPTPPTPDNEEGVKVFGIYETEDGRYLADVRVNGHVGVMLDVDGDGVFDGMLVDVNDNGEFEDEEAFDIQNAGITLEHLATMIEEPIDNPGPMYTTYDGEKNEDPDPAAESDSNEDEDEMEELVSHKDSDIEILDYTGEAETEDDVAPDDGLAEISLTDDPSGEVYVVDEPSDSIIDVDEYPDSDVVLTEAEVVEISIDEVEPVVPEVEPEVAEVEPMVVEADIVVGADSVDVIDDPQYDGMPDTVDVSVPDTEFEVSDHGLGMSDDTMPDFCNDAEDSSLYI
ncbi:MAG: hypothetical protein K2F64_05785 [Muribaculaceae bacterium]|nr:hypothetical protein [Muribaculaceae bacterium]